MGVLQVLANRVAANRWAESDRLARRAAEAAALVEVVTTDPTTGLTIVRDGAGNTRLASGLEGAPKGSVSR
jgi:hypothetical protein